MKKQAKKKATAGGEYAAAELSFEFLTD